MATVIAGAVACNLIFQNNIFCSTEGNITRCVKDPNQNITKLAIAALTLTSVGYASMKLGSEAMNKIGAFLDKKNNYKNNTSKVFFGAFASFMLARVTHII